MRPSKRQNDELRRVSFERGFSMHAEGSCLIKFGNTHVLCTASLEERLPPWLKGQGRGWITAEYGMLPRAQPAHPARSDVRPSLRTHPGNPAPDRPRPARRRRSSQARRAPVVIQADGGTRTAAITGSWIALHDCIKWMQARSMVKEGVLRDQVAAVSAGIYAGSPVLDLDYAEDSEADADANFVMTGSGGIVEVQGTAEKELSAGAFRRTDGASHARASRNCCRCRS